MILSQRLQSVASLVTPGLVLADIGTDHAYIPVELVERGTVPGSIAMDVNEGPLERARRNIEAAGLQEKIVLRLSDGLSALRPGEAQCAVIAGMGGPLMMRIIGQSLQTALSLEEMVLQPQSDLPALRRFLFTSGFRVVQEEMVLEDGKYYPMMRVKPEDRKTGDGSLRFGDAADADEELLFFRFGPLLLKKCHPVLEDYLRREDRICGEILANLANAASDRGEVRRQEVLSERKQVLDALNYYRSAQ